MVRFCCSDDGRSDDGLAQHPSQSNLSARNRTFFCNLSESLDHLAIGLFSIRVHFLAELVSFGALRLAFPWTRQASSRQRAPRNHTYAFRLAIRNHLPLLFAVKQVVMI